MELTDFDVKEKKFFENYDITINPKTSKWNKDFYIDENQEFQLGKLPPLIHHYTLESCEQISVEVCKFCWNPLPETEEKGHDKIFCGKKCKNRYYKIQKIFEEKKDKEPNITGIFWEPEIIEMEKGKTKETFVPKKYKVPEKIMMKIVYKDKPSIKEGVPLTKRKRTIKDDS